MRVCIWRQSNRLDPEPAARSAPKYSPQLMAKDRAPLRASPNDGNDVRTRRVGAGGSGGKEGDATFIVLAGRSTTNPGPVRQQPGVAPAGRSESWKFGGETPRARLGSPRCGACEQLS